MHGWRVGRSLTTLRCMRTSRIPQTCCQAKTVLPYETFTQKPIIKSYHLGSHARTCEHMAIKVIILYVLLLS